VLLAEGKNVLLKRGSVGDPVRRVQRGLTAALDSKVAVTGVVNAGTTRAVMRYQRTTGLPQTGVVDPATWAELEAGRR
jgi:peptidoglycan hydrolase-like protein with peptidoglycan-binding domain